MIDRSLIACALVTAAAAGPAFAQQRFVIEREIPGASKMTRRAAA